MCSVSTLRSQIKKSSVSADLEQESPLHRVALCLRFGHIGHTAHYEPMARSVHFD